ncbi:MAG: MFS transporter [Spongiibacteraceae bacterium]
MTEKLPQRPPVALVLIALIFAELTAGFETTMIYAALKTLMQTFHNPIGVGWLITIYLLVSAAAAAICGRLGDIYGRRRMVLIVLGMAVVGSFVSAFATSLPWVICGRGIQGMAGAIMPLCFGLARENLPEDKVALGIGVVTATASVGAGAGLIVGGLLIDNFSWNAIFMVSGTMAVISLIGVRLCVPPSPERRTGEKLDLLGGLLFVPAIAAVLLAISNGAAWGWLDSRTLGLTAGGLALLAFWVFYELRQKTPLINVRLLANRNVATANIVMALIGLGTMNVMQILSLLVQQPAWTAIGLGATATMAGLMKLPSNVFGVFASTWSGYMSGKRGGRFSMICGISIFTTGWLLLIPMHSSIWEVIAMLVLISVGTSIAYTGVPSLIVATAPADRTSEATGLMTVIRSVAQGIGAQLIVFLLATETISDATQGPGIFPARDAYLLAFAVIGSTGVLAALIALTLPKARPLPQPAPA